MRKEARLCHRRVEVPRSHLHPPKAQAAAVHAVLRRIRLEHRRVQACYNRDTRTRACISFYQKESQRCYNQPMIIKQFDVLAALI